MARRTAPRGERSRWPHFRRSFIVASRLLLLDLTAHPDVKFVRAHWDVARWGRGVETPMFEFGVRLKEIPADVLREASRDAKVLP